MCRKTFIFFKSGVVSLDLSICTSSVFIFRAKCVLNVSYIKYRGYRDYIGVTERCTYCLARRFYRTLIMNLMFFPLRAHSNYKLLIVEFKFLMRYKLF